jgi:hypothetical protein
MSQRSDELAIAGHDEERGVFRCPHPRQMGVERAPVIGMLRRERRHSNGFRDPASGSNSAYMSSTVSGRRATAKCHGPVPRVMGRNSELS